MDCDAYSFSPESADAIRNGMYQFREFRRFQKPPKPTGTSKEDQGSDTEEEHETPAPGQATGGAALAALQQKSRGRPRGRMPHATITKDFELVVKEIIMQSARGGEGILVFLPGIGEITELHDQLLPLEQIGTNAKGSGIEYRIFVLHSLIPKDEQESAVFKAPSEKICHVILASNIAESSLTIPNIRYVIDFGLRRQLVYDSRRHMSCLSTTWVSQASVKQRMGRTGRVFAGTNIRLYTRGFYESLPEFDAPEMETAPLEKLYVNVKFLAAKLPPFPIDPGGVPRKLKPRELLRLTAQPPDTTALERSVATLVEMGALTSNSEEAQLSLLGHLMLTLPLDIYLCRLVVYGALFGCVADAIVIASGLSTQDPFTLPTHLVIKDQTEYAQAVKRSFLSRKHFDAGQYSEPLMLRNMFVQWMVDFYDFKEKQVAHRRGYVQENHRASFTKFSQNFARSYAVAPKRCVHLCMNVLDTATRFKKFIHKDSQLYDDISRLIYILSPYYYEEAKPSDLFNTSGPILKSLLLASFSPNLLIGNTKLRDGENPKRKKAGADNLNAKESLMQDMLMKGIDPRRAVQIVLEIPKDIESRETMKEDLQETFSQIMACDPRDIIINLEPDWKKLYIEFRTESQIGTPEETGNASTLQDHQGDYYNYSSTRDRGIFPELSALCRQENEDIQTLPLGATLIDMFGAGRFRFHARLVEATFHHQDRYNENKQNNVIPLANTDLDGTPQAGSTSAPEDQHDWVQDFYNETPDLQNYWGGGGEDEIYLNFYKPISPFEIVWDVYSNENMLTTRSVEELRSEEYEKAVALQEGGKKAKKKDVIRLMEQMQRKKIKPIKGNCTWRNVLGALTSCNLSKMEPELSQYLDESSNAAARRPRWQLPQIQPPIPNEIVACYTSQQGASDVQYTAQQGGAQAVQTVWLDGVTILSCNFYEKPVSESVSNSEPNESCVDADPKAQLPSLYATVLMLAFCPSNYAVNVSGNFDSGRVSKIEIGSHAPLRCCTPDKSVHLHIRDIERVNRLRKIISDAFLGRDTSMYEQCLDAAKRQQAGIGSKPDLYPPGSTPSESKVRDAFDLPATTAGADGGLAAHMRAATKSSSYERPTETNDSEVGGLEVPMLVDSPCVRKALEELLHNIGEGPNVCRDMPEDIEFTFKNLDIHNFKHYYDPSLYCADANPSMVTGITHTFDVPTRVKRASASGRANKDGVKATTPGSSSTSALVESDYFQQFFVKTYYKNPFFNCPHLQPKTHTINNPDYHPSWEGYGPQYGPTLQYTTDPMNNLDNFRLLKPAVSLEALRDIRIRVLKEQRGSLPLPTGAGPTPVLGKGGKNDKVKMPQKQAQAEQLMRPQEKKYLETLYKQIAGFDEPPKSALPQKAAKAGPAVNKLKPLPGNIQGLATHVLSGAAHGAHHPAGGPPGHGANAPNALALQVQSTIKPFQQVKKKKSTKNKEKPYVKGELTAAIDIDNWLASTPDDDEVGGDGAAAERAGDGQEDDDDDDEDESSSSDEDAEGGDETTPMSVNSGPPAGGVNNSSSPHNAAGGSRAAAFTYNHWGSSAAAELSDTTSATQASSKINLGAWGAPSGAASTLTASTGGWGAAATGGGRHDKMNNKASYPYNATGAGASTGKGGTNAAPGFGTSGYGAAGGASAGAGYHVQHGASSKGATSTGAGGSSWATTTAPGLAAGGTSGGQGGGAPGLAAPSGGGAPASSQHQQFSTTAANAVGGFFGAADDSDDEDEEEDADTSPPNTGTHAEAQLKGGGTTSSKGGNKGVGQATSAQYYATRNKQGAGGKYGAHLAASGAGKNGAGTSGAAGAGAGSFGAAAAKGGGPVAGAGAVSSGGTYGATNASGNSTKGGGAPAGATSGKKGSPTEPSSSASSAAEAWGGSTGGAASGWYPSASATSKGTSSAASKGGTTAQQSASAGGWGHTHWGSSGYGGGYTDGTTSGGATGAGTDWWSTGAASSTAHGSKGALSGKKGVSAAAWGSAGGGGKQLHNAPWAASPVEGGKNGLWDSTAKGAKAGMKGGKNAAAGALGAVGGTAPQHYVVADNYTNSALYHTGAVHHHPTSGASSASAEGEATWPPDGSNTTIDHHQYAAAAAAHVAHGVDHGGAVLGADQDYYGGAGYTARAAAAAAAAQKPAAKNPGLPANPPPHAPGYLTKTPGGGNISAAAVARAWDAAQTAVSWGQEVGLGYAQTAAAASAVPEHHDYTSSAAVTAGAVPGVDHYYATQAAVAAGAAAAAATSTQPVVVQRLAEQHIDPTTGVPYQTRKKAGSTQSATGVDHGTKKKSPSSPEQGPSGDIPNGWKEAQDPKTGRKYYWNVATKQTQWKKPTAAATATAGAGGGGATSGASTTGTTGAGAAGTSATGAAAATGVTAGGVTAEQASATVAGHETAGTGSNVAEAAVSGASKLSASAQEFRPGAETENRNFEHYAATAHSAAAAAHPAAAYQLIHPAAALHHRAAADHAAYYYAAAQHPATVAAAAAQQEAAAYPLAAAAAYIHPAAYHPAAGAAAGATHAVTYPHLARTGAAATYMDTTFHHAAQ
ncbi:unnamed protein product [Amoebophrya sp. A25]|nr:unnamed protein product [Amoebophrya sp. A25]|eukprot:GSA25T00009600001.1